MTPINPSDILNKRYLTNLDSDAVSSVSPNGLRGKNLFQAESPCSTKASAANRNARSAMREAINMDVVVLGVRTELLIVSCWIAAAESDLVDSVSR